MTSLDSIKVSLERMDNDSDESSVHGDELDRILVMYNDD
jgi:hypothetical protein